MHLHGSLPEETALTVATRSGNVQDPAEKGWSNWTDEAPATEFVQIHVAAGAVPAVPADVHEQRSGQGVAGGGGRDVAYQMPNLAAGDQVDQGGSRRDSAAKRAAAAAAQRRRRVVDAGQPIPRQPQADDRLGGGRRQRRPAAVTRSTSAAAPGPPWILLKDKLTENHVRLGHAVGGRRAVRGEGGRLRRRRQPARQGQDGRPRERPGPGRQHRRRSSATSSASSKGAA